MIVVELTNDAERNADDARFIAYLTQMARERAEWINGTEREGRQNVKTCSNT